ncbi:MAG: NAD(P)-dependent alcohol dehydrogenase [Cyanobacteriota bacterium]
MKAAIIMKYGNADCIEYKEIPDPKIGDNEVLLKVYAASINPVDWKVRNGKFKIITGYKFPKVLGFECAGEILELGKNVTDFKKGDRVIGATFKGCYSELAVIKKNKLVKMPDNLSYKDASTIPIACMTAYFSLLDLGKLKKGQKVLINGASGGVGLYAVQIAHIIGAEVTGICSEKNFDLVRSFGKIKLIDYHKTDFTTQNEKYNVIFDVVNTLSFEKCKKSLEKKGTLIGTDISSRILKDIALSLFSCKKTKIINNNPKPIDVQNILSYFEKGKLKAVIDKEFPLEQACEAHKYSESGRAKGKIILVP